MNKGTILLTATVAAICHTSYAEKDQEIEEILVMDSPEKLNNLNAKTIDLHANADLGATFETLPGANINRNGPLTSLIQYRGAYGDRVAVNIDGGSVVTAGPNAMDSPLSYLPNALSSSIKVVRGIAPVSSSQESIGGQVEATSYTGEFTDSDAWKPTGKINSTVNSNGEGLSFGGAALGANNTHKAGVRLSYDSGDNAEFGGGGKLPSTEYNRQRADLIYGFNSKDTSFGLMFGRSETTDTGTAALPMDIIEIESNLLNTHFAHTVGKTEFKGAISYSDTYHVMDNFSLRNPMLEMMRYRANTAEGDKKALKGSVHFPMLGGQLAAGLDHSSTNHTATITNPNNSMFAIQNFNDASKEITGLYTEWQNNLFDVGLRLNKVTTDSDYVSASGLMGMMGTIAAGFADSFNTPDLKQEETNLDYVVKSKFDLGTSFQMEIGIGKKTRTPSYQERYLWIPMQSTGGLADGRTYVGSPYLASETSTELNLGASYANDYFYSSLHTYYRKIENYIQGTPALDMNVVMFSNMMANMMGMMATPPLIFDNVDAKIYGGEWLYGWNISKQWKVDGALAYVKGKRDDIDDNLYRIAPLNNRLSLSYQAEQYGFAIESVLYDRQEDVSVTNGEQETAGYGLVNIRSHWNPTSVLTVSFIIDNIADKKYQDHLAGYNRVMGAEDVAMGERLYGIGRNFRLGLAYDW